MRAQGTAGTNTGCGQGPTEAGEQEDGALHTHPGPTGRETREREQAKTPAGRPWAPDCWEDGDETQKQIQRPTSLKEKNKTTQNEKHQDGVSRTFSIPEHQEQVSVRGKHLRRECYSRILGDSAFPGVQTVTDAACSAPVTSGSHRTARAHLSKVPLPNHGTSPETLRHHLTQLAVAVKLSPWSPPCPPP